MWLTNTAGEEGAVEGESGSRHVDRSHNMPARLAGLRESSAKPQSSANHAAIDRVDSWTCDVYVGGRLANIRKARGGVDKKAPREASNVERLAEGWRKVGG
jgi:hypothetical protein